MTLFTDPVAQAIITTPDESAEWKWSMPDFPFLTGVSINYEMGVRVPVMTLSFDIPYEDGMAMMVEPSPFAVNNLVKVRIGYASGEWTPWAAGFLKAGGDGLTIDANGFSGTITVQGLAESYGYTVSKDVLRDAGNDPVTMIEKCAYEMGLKPVISAGASAAMNDYLLVAGRRGKAIRKQMFDFASGLVNLSYWELLKRFSQKFNITYWVGPELGSKDPGKGIYFYTNDEISRGEGQETTARTYGLRRPIDEPNLLYPCLAWTPEGAGFTTWLASRPDAAAHGVTAFGTDSGTGEIVDASVKPEEQPLAVYGVVADLSPENLEVQGVKGDSSKGDGTEGQVISAPVATGGKGVLKSQAQHRQLQGNAVQRGVITTLGMPDERPANLCKLVGLGSIYDGPYVVHKMTHTYAPGSWETTLTVQRDGRLIRSGDQKETLEGQMKAD